MPITANNSSIENIYYGDKRIIQVYHGSELIYQGAPTETDPALLVCNTSGTFSLYKGTYKFILVGYGGEGGNGYSLSYKRGSAASGGGGGGAGYVTIITVTLDAPTTASYSVGSLQINNHTYWLSEGSPGTSAGGNGSSGGGGGGKAAASGTTSYSAGAAGGKNGYNGKSSTYAGGSGRKGTTGQDAGNGGGTASNAGLPGKGGKGAHSLESQLLQKSYFDTVTADQIEAVMEGGGGGGGSTGGTYSAAAGGGGGGGWLDGQDAYGSASGSGCKTTGGKFGYGAIIYRKIA